MHTCTNLTNFTEVCKWIH